MNTVFNVKNSWQRLPSALAVQGEQHMTQSSSARPTQPLSPSTRSWPPGQPFSLDVPQTSLYDNLRVSAQRYPDKVALWYYGREVLYRELLAEADALSGHLAAAGVGHGDRVLIAMQNSPQWVAAAHATWRLGAVLVPLPPMLRPDEYRYFLEDAGVTVGVVGGEQYADVKAAGLAHAVVADLSEGTTLPLPTGLDTRPELQPGDVSWQTALRASPAPEAEVGTQDLAALPYTSGTTGKPKGAMHTHGSVQANVTGSAVMRGANPADVLLMTLPLFHVSAFVHDMLMGLYLGNRVVMMARWDKALARELTRTQGVTVWFAITTLVVDLLSLPDLSAADMPTLRMIVGGGAAMPEALARQLRDLIGLTFVEGYGLTETISQSHFNPMNRPKLQCLGLPVFDVDSRIVDPESGQEVPQGEVGEIVTRGPQVFQGYWNRPEATAEAFLELGGQHFFRTGDLGYVDAEGYFFFVDRLKRMVNVGGMKVWPAEVEALLHAHPAVQEACVIAVPDTRTGERVCAVIVPRPGQHPDEAALIGWAREHMAHYKAPREVRFVDALPRGATGKVAWRSLQEEATLEVETRGGWPRVSLS